MVLGIRNGYLQRYMNLELATLLIQRGYCNKLFHSAKMNTCPGTQISTRCFQRAVMEQFQFADSDNGIDLLKYDGRIH